MRPLFEVLPMLQPLGHVHVLAQSADQIRLVQGFEYFAFLL